MRIEQALRNLFTGVERRRPPTARATLDAAHSAYGTWKNVAAAMGISERTLRRVRTGLVSPRSRQRIADLTNDAAVRQATVTTSAARRLTRMRTRGVRLMIRGTQGPRGYGQTDNARFRTIDVTISPGRMEDVANAFFEGNDAEAVARFEEAITEDYARGWPMAGTWEVQDDAEYRFNV